MKTIKFSATLGIVAGYNHGNTEVQELAALATASLAWQNACLKTFQKTGQYPSASVSLAKTIYHTNWGCPVGGEISVVISGEANPEYTTPEIYRNTVLLTLKLAGRALGQKTCQASFWEVDLAYCDFRTQKEKREAAKTLAEDRK